VPPGVAPHVDKGSELEVGTEDGPRDTEPQWKAAVAGLAAAGLNVFPHSRVAPPTPRRGLPVATQLPPTATTAPEAPQPVAFGPSAGELTPHMAGGAAVVATPSHTPPAPPPPRTVFGGSEGGWAGIPAPPVRGVPGAPGAAGPPSPGPARASPSAVPPQAQQPTGATSRGTRAVGPPSAQAGIANAAEEALWEPLLQLGQSPADQSLLPPGKAGDLDLWRGWTVETSSDGHLFYYHVASGTSQWQMPRELSPVLGEWEQVCDDEGDRYWRNELLGVSSWKDPRRTTDLFQAALDGNLFFLQLYAGFGGLLDAVDAKGRTALHYNCAGGSTQAVLYLLQNKATVDLPDQTGSSPLHWACRYGHAPIVRILLMAKAAPDRQNSLGDTSMHEAAALGRSEPLHWLIHARANPLLLNRESRTPAQVAVRNRAEEAAALLQRHEKRRRWRGTRGHRAGTAVCSPVHGGETTELSEGSESEDAAQGMPSSPGPKALRQAAARAREQDAGSGTEEDPEPSLALVVVRAARPLLRGVQWLANRVLGEKKTDLGDSNKFDYDAQTGQWVLRKPERAPSSDLDDSATSAASGTDEEPPRVRRPPTRLRLGRRQARQSDSEGAPGVV